MSVLTDLENLMRSVWGNRRSGLTTPVAVTIGAGVNTFEYPYVLTDTGTAAMTGITVPYNGFQGKISIFPGGAFTWTTATNIAVAGTAVANRLLEFHYNPYSAKWYPSYV